MSPCQQRLGLRLDQIQLLRARAVQRLFVREKDGERVRIALRGGEPSGRGNIER